MFTGTVVQVTEHVAGTDLAAVPYVGALWPSEELWPSESLWPSTVTQLELVDPDELDRDGGYVTLVDANGNEETIIYAFAEGQDVIELFSAPTGTYAIGDMVYMTDSVGTRFPERWAQVMQPQGEETILCRVPHSLYDKLAMGIRNDDNAEQITFGMDGTDAVVTDVLGKSPVQDLGSVLVTTSPDGTGQRVDMDDAGVRLIDAADDTIINLPTDETQEPTFTGHVAATGLDLHEDSVLTTGGINVVQWLGLDNPTALRAWVAGFYSSATHTLQLGVTSGVVQARLQLDATDAGFGQVVASVGVNAKTVLQSDGTSDFEFDTSAGWQNWTPTLTGWSANPASGAYRYKQTGKTVTCMINQPNAGTSNDTTKTISLPVTAATVAGANWSGPCSIVDNGVAATTSGRASVSSAATTASIFTNWGGGAWTNSGSARIANLTLIYEAA